MGMCLDEKIKIKLTNKNIKKYYKELGYNIDNPEIEVFIKDLKSTSKIKIKCICDNCKKIFFRRRSKINNNELIVCKDCRSYKTKQTNLKKYGVENVSQCKEIRKKIKQTNLEKYGAESFTNTSIFKEKRINTNINKYGTKYFVESDIFKEKNKQTLLSKYDVDHNLKIPQIKIKRQQTWNENYGVNHPWASKEIQKKIKQTNLEKYGTENAMQNQEIKNKVINTNIKRYGCKYVLQNKEIRNKIRKSMIKKYGTPNVYCRIPCSKQQYYIGMLLKCDGYNKFIECGYPDIIFNNEKLLIEYDGGGHYLSVKKGYPLEKFIENEKNKEQIYIKNGYKIIRIISSKDLLPCDDEIIQYVNMAKNYLLTNNIVKINIDTKKIIVNNFEKDISFSYLRKITKENINARFE